MKKKIVTGIGLGLASPTVAEQLKAFDAKVYKCDTVVDYRGEPVTRNKGKNKRWPRKW